MRTLLAIMMLLTTASRALAAVSCADPDHLCTGDPCVIGTLAVETPCEVDFGNRVLQITGTLSVPDGGVLTLRAARVDLAGHIDGRHVGVGVGSGAAVSLTATSASAVLDGTIDVSGTLASGSVYVAGRTGVELDASIRARSKLAPGGGVTLGSAAGGVLVTRPIDVRGSTGGTIWLEGSAVVFGTLDARGRAGNGGLVWATGPYVTFFRTIDLRGKGGDGGTFHASAGNLLEVQPPVKVLATGSANGGAIELLVTPAGWGMRIAGTLRARGFAQNGGSLAASGPSARIGVSAKVDLRGAASGGTVAIDGDELFVDRARMTVAGGATAGTIRMTQLAGDEDALIDGTFDAHPSGTIELSAPAVSMTVTGMLLAGPAGCVGVSAGGMLDTTGARSDVPLVASCP